MGDGGRPVWWATDGQIPSAEFSAPTLPGRAVFEPADPAKHKPVTGTVSVARLVNAPPAKALKEMEKGAKAVEEGDREKAIEHYERALEIHPNYVEAHNNLGVQLIRTGRPERAISALEKAVELDPGSIEPHLNLSIALHGAGDLEAAAYQAELAVELDPRSPSANMGLGMVLAAQGRELEEAVERLVFASAEFPGASLAAADALLQLNRPQDAHAVLRAYLHRVPQSLK